jgi:hypothetical protein
MSTGPTPTSPTPPAPGALGKQLPLEIKVIAHSSLFYWWPVWFFGLLFALWTYADNNRLAIIGPESKIVNTGPAPDGKDRYVIQVEGDTDRLIKDSEAVNAGEGKSFVRPKPRVSTRSWMGPLFLLILFLVIIITNVPLRGLWSLVTIIGIVVISLILSLMEKWDELLQAMGDLHVYINMAGYLAISIALLIAWLVAVWVFDRRTYIIFTAGQVKVCEEIGGREKVYDTTGMTMEKRRDDWFRHIILGFGTGDLLVRAAGADRHEIVLPNVAFIGYKIDAIESMLRARQTTPKT